MQLKSPGGKELAMQNPTDDSFQSVSGSSRGRVGRCTLAVLKFIFNWETREILGRTPLSWVKILAFYTTLYIILGGILLVHLIVFLRISPVPGINITPWNFGGYGYSNFPNSKIEFILIPDLIILHKANRTATTTSDNIEYLRRMAGSAKKSGVHSQCHQWSTGFGYEDGTACLFLHIAKVFKWTPEMIAPMLKTQNWLEIDCVFQLSHEHGGFQIISETPGIPLNLPNNANGRSFPFNNHPNYTVPILGLRLDLQRIPSHNVTRGHIYCNVDFIALNMSKPASKLLKRQYEIPAEATTIIRFRD